MCYSKLPYLSGQVNLYSTLSYLSKKKNLQLRALPGRRSPRPRRKVVPAAAPQPAVLPLVNELKQRPPLPLQRGPSINSPLPYQTTAFFPFGPNRYCRRGEDDEEDRPPQPPTTSLKPYLSSV